MSFFAMGGGGEAPIAIVGSVAGNVSSVESSTHSLGNIDVGAASLDKNCIVVITMEYPSTRSINTMTVGGVSLTEKLSAKGGGTPDLEAWIFAGDIASINGSQAISVTFSATVSSAGCSAVAVSGLQSLTETDSATDSTGSDVQMTLVALSAQAGGITFAGGCCGERVGTATWGSMTEKADLETGADSEDHRHTAAWDLGARASANETLDFSEGSKRAVCGISFR